MDSQLLPREGADRPSPNGFSLIELLTVLVVVGIAVSIAAPRLDFERHAVNAATVSVGSLLLRAQREAVQEQHPVVIGFDAAGDRLRIHDDTDGDLVIDPGESVVFEPLGEGIQLSRGYAPAMFPTQEPVTFSFTQDGLPAIAFQRNGSVSEEGGFYLTSVRAASSPAHASDTRAVAIQRSTGRLRWFSYKSESWEEES